MCTQAYVGLYVYTRGARLVDGFHRIAAIKSASSEIPKIEADVRQGSLSSEDSEEISADEFWRSGDWKQST